eukprot:scaffold593_cov382-Prasinococcus_capsulatus_cf.AAC.5
MPSAIAFYAIPAAQGIHTNSETTHACPQAMRQRQFVVGHRAMGATLPRCRSTDVHDEFSSLGPAAGHFHVALGMGTSRAQRLAWTPSASL